MTIPYGINNAGDVVGTAGYSGAAFRAFVLRSGRFRFLDFPGHSNVETAGGVNNLGQIAGYTIDGSDEHAYQYKNGRFRTLNFPGALFTHAQGINDAGVVVGWYFIYPNLYGFAYKNGKYLSFAYPGALYTGGFAINVSGQIVGQYQLDDNVWHGFVTSPITVADFQDPGN